MYSTRSVRCTLWLSRTPGTAVPPSPRARVSEGTVSALGTPAKNGQGKVFIPRSYSGKINRTKPLENKMDGWNK